MIPGNAHTLVSKGTVTIEASRHTWIEREVRALQFVKDKTSQRQHWVVDNDSIKELAEKSGTTEQEIRSIDLIYVGVAEHLELHVFRMEVRFGSGDSESKKAHPEDIISYLYLKAK